MRRLRPPHRWLAPAVRQGTGATLRVKRSASWLVNAPAAVPHARVSSRKKAFGAAGCRRKAAVGPRQGATRGTRRPAHPRMTGAHSWLAMSLAIHKGGSLRPDTRFKERHPSPPSTGKSATLRHPGIKNSGREFPASAATWKRRGPQRLRHRRQRCPHPRARARHHPERGSCQRPDRPARAVVSRRLTHARRHSHTSPPTHLLQGQGEAGFVSNDEISARMVLLLLVGA